MIGGDIKDHEVVIFDFTGATYLDDSAAMLIAQLLDVAAKEQTESIVMGLAGPVAGTLYALDILRNVPDNHVVETLDEARQVAKDPRRPVSAPGNPLGGSPKSVREDARFCESAVSFDPHCYDVGIMVLLVTHRRGNVAQQAQRQLALVGSFGPFPQQHHHVLEVLVTDGGHKLQLKGAPVAVGEQKQTPLLPGFFPFLRHPKAQQRVLAGKAA